MDDDEPWFNQTLLPSAGPSSGHGGILGNTLDDTGRNIVPTNQHNLSAEEKAQRARESRRRYLANKKAEKERVETQLEEGRKELERLKLEQVALADHGRALSSLGNYAACLLQALTEAKNSASHALNASMQGLHQAQDWARHQYIMLPTAVELMTTSLWTPSESQMRWVLQHTNTDEYENGHQVFFNRIAELLREGQRNPSSLERVEKRVETLMALWVKFALILIEERREPMEQHLCSKQVSEFKRQQKAAETSPSAGGVSSQQGGIYGAEYPAQASPAVSAAAVAAVASAYEDEDGDENDVVAGAGSGAGGSVGGSTGNFQRQLAVLQSQPIDLGLNFPSVTLQQKETLSKLWKQFKISVRAARRDLSEAVGAATAAYIANVDFLDGSFAPESSASMAESYLTTVEAAAAADAFVKRESRAYMELFVNIIQLLTPLQLAHIKVAPHLQPLVPHLPLVCHLLLEQANVMGLSSREGTTGNNTSSDGSADKNPAAVVEVPRIQMINE